MAAEKIRARACSLCSVAVAALLLSPAVLSGQALQGITGTVTDPTGAVIPNAKVSATDNATGVVNKTTTNSQGTYQFPALIPGTYTVTSTAPGFRTGISKGVVVSVSKASNVNITLQPGTQTQTVEVTASPIALQTARPQLGTTIEHQVVQRLPNEISGGLGRQIDNFIFLAPGVTGSSFSHRINGGVDFENEIVFNGVPMAQSETQGFQTIMNPPYEMVQSFNVLRSTFSAKYGLAQGVVTYHTQSGTNQFHGDAFEIIRNNVFDARGAYNSAVPVDKQNNYGFSIGGPIIIPHVYNGKNKTFFWLSMAWSRYNQTDTNFMSLPTAAEKAGDFNGVATIYDPTTGLPFPNNTIPSTRFSSVRPV